MARGTRPAVAAAVLAGAVALGAGLRLWLAWCDNGIDWPDEIYQGIEPAHRLAFGYGLLPWEYIEGLRSWAFPGIIAAVLKGCAWLGLDAPGAYLVVLRTLLALAGVGTALGVHRLARDSGAGPRAAALGAASFALSAPAIYFAPRAMSEIVTALPVTFGLALAWRRDAGTRTRILAGSLLGLAVLLRLQNGLFCAAALAVQAAGRRWRAALHTGAALLGWGVLLGALDRVTWGSWFHSARAYLGYNLLAGGAAHYGTEPLGFYLRVLWSSMGPAAIVVGLLALVAVRRAPGLAGAGALFLLVYSLVPHKELRFIYAVLPLLCASAAVGLEAVFARGRPLLSAAAAGAVLLLSLGSAATFHRLSSLDVGHPGGGASSAYDRFGPVNRLLMVAHDQDDLCGLKAEGVMRVWIGGLSHLHRDVPLYDMFGPDRRMGYFNYVIRCGPAQPGDTEIAADQGCALRRLPGARCVRDGRYSSVVSHRFTAPLRGVAWPRWPP